MADEETADWYRLGEGYTGWIAQQQEVLMVPVVETLSLMRTPRTGVDKFPL
jgi:hypothetical protein